MSRQDRRDALGFGVLLFGGGLGWWLHPGAGIAAVGFLVVVLTLVVGRPREKRQARGET